MDNPKTSDIFNQIVSCMDELAEAKGVARCGLMYALASLLETYKEQTDKTIESLEATISDLKAQIHELSTGKEEVSS